MKVKSATLSVVYVDEKGKDKKQTLFDYTCGTGETLDVSQDKAFHLVYGPDDLSVKPTAIHELGTLKTTITLSYPPVTRAIAETPPVTDKKAKG